MTAQAEIVQIDLGHVYSTLTAPNNLIRDLTGDGSDDLAMWNLQTISNTGFRGVSTNFSVKGLRLVGSYYGSQAAFAKWTFTSTTSSGSTSRYYRALVRNKDIIAGGGAQGPNPFDREGLIQIRFTDSRINGGAETNGYLHVRAQNFSTTEHEIELIRLIFDDASTDYPITANAGTSYPPANLSESDLGEAALLSNLRDELTRLQKKLRKTKAALRRARLLQPRLLKKPSSLQRHIQRVGGKEARLLKRLRKLQRKIRQIESRILAAIN